MHRVILILLPNTVKTGQTARSMEQAILVPMWPGRINGAQALHLLPIIGMITSLASSLCRHREASHAKEENILWVLCLAAAPCMLDASQFSSPIRVATHEVCFGWLVCSHCVLAATHVHVRLTRAARPAPAADRHGVARDGAARTCRELTLCNDGMEEQSSFSPRPAGRTAGLDQQPPRGHQSTYRM
jgi:hypothetical protein